MKRTPGDTARRRTLAAAGFPHRAAVVIYARIAPGEDQHDVIARLRRHAQARDWEAVGEFVDHTPAAIPLENRPYWPQAWVLITSGQAQGIVTTSRTECADTAGASVLDELLSEHQAFLSEETPAVEGAVR